MCSCALKVLILVCENNTKHYHDPLSDNESACEEYYKVGLYIYSALYHHTTPLPLVCEEFSSSLLQLTNGLTIFKISDRKKTN